MTPSDGVFISAIISIITLIVFFIMASNISAIRKKIDSHANKKPIINYADAYTRGELKEYLGKSGEALDCYNEAYFLLQKFILTGTNGDAEKKNKEMIISKIKSLNGSPKEI